MIVVVLIVGSISFYGGLKFQENKFKQTNAFQYQAQGTGENGRFQQAGRRGLRPENGEILDRDEKGITIKLRDGQSKIILFSNKTVIKKTQEATKNDLKKGEQVVIFGSENTDGIVSAENIQLNPNWKNTN